MRRAPGVRRTAPRVELTPAEVGFVRRLVVHQDAAVLALNKPAGLSSQGGRGQAHTLDELLWAFAKSGGKRPRLIHRLDRDTSGVILAARTQPAAAYLGRAMMERRFEKTYIALVGDGAPRTEDGDLVEGLIDTPLRREEIGREAYMRACTIDHLAAESALTRWRTLASAPGVALLELKPETGRMHQLRVHLASVGRPILGDPRYGGALAVGGAAIPRLMLHAAELGFPHPNGGVMRLRASPPEDFAATAAALGLPLPS